MDELNSNPEYVASRERDRREAEAREAEYRAAERPLVKELLEAGYNVDSAWDLVNSAGTYPDALPILLAHLDRSYPDAVREGIARAMAVPQSRFAWHHLVHLYRDEDAGRVKDGLATAIAAVAWPDVLGELIELAKDRKHGASRLLLLSALEHSADSAARSTLMKLGTDPDLGEEIQAILKRSKGKAPRD